MNKNDIIDRLADRLGDKKVAAAALEGFIDIVERGLAKGERVAITGFGTFDTSVRAARTGRNPQTGAAVKLKKSTVAKFRTGTRLKAVANGTVKVGREPKHDPLLPAGVTALVKRLDSPTTTPAKKSTPARTAAKKAAKTAQKQSAPVKSAAKKLTAAASAPAKRAAKKAAPAKKTAAKKAPAKSTAKRTTKK